MTAFATSVITGGTLLKVVVGALLAGVGVTLAFSLLLYCTDRASSLRRPQRPLTTLLFRAASALSGLAVLAIIAYSLILTISKPK